MLDAKLLVRIIDGLKKFGKAGRFVDRPKAREPVAQHVHIALG